MDRRADMDKMNKISLQPLNYCMRMVTFIQFPWILRSTTLIHRGTKTKGVRGLHNVFPGWLISLIYTYTVFICRYTLYMHI